MFRDEFSNFVLEGLEWFLSAESRCHFRGYTVMRFLLLLINAIF
jgi:hypothetical protein